MQRQISLALDALRRYRQSPDDKPAAELDRAIGLLRRVTRRDRRKRQRRAPSGPLTDEKRVRGYELQIDESGQFLVFQPEPWDTAMVWRLLPAALEDLEQILDCRGLENLRIRLPGDCREFTLLLLGPVVLHVELSSLNVEETREEV